MIKNITTRLPREVLESLDLAFLQDDKGLYVGAKVEITILDKGTFFGVISRLGSASLTLARPEPIDVYENEDKYINRNHITFDIADVVEAYCF